MQAAFITHYSSAPTFAYTPLANLIPAKSVNVEYRLVNYLVQNDKVKKSLPQQSSPAQIANPEPIAEIRTVRVDLPKQMGMGESSQV